MRNLTLLLLISLNANAHDYGWLYSSGQDKLDGTYYSVATVSPHFHSGPRKAHTGLDPDLDSIGFRCERGIIRFELMSEKLISKYEYTLAYRVDSKPYNKTQLKAAEYYDRSKVAYIELGSAAKIAIEIIGGLKIYIRLTESELWPSANKVSILDWDEDISLRSSDVNIKRVFADCGINLSDSQSQKKAFEAPSSLGIPKSKKMQSEDNSRSQRESLDTLMAQAVEDITLGRIQNLSEIQDYVNLPVHLRIQLAQDVDKQLASFKGFQQFQQDYDASGALHNDDEDKYTLMEFISDFEKSSGYKQVEILLKLKWLMLVI